MTLIILGAFLLLGLVADVVGRHTFLPRVTLLLLGGLLVGSSGLDLIPSAFVDNWFSALTQFALAMVGFLLGQQLTFAELKLNGVRVFVVALGKVVGAAAAVALALIAIGVDAALALIFAGIATATAPAATFDVVQELHIESGFAKLLLGVVALDDALGLIIFAFLVAFAQSLNGAPVDVLPTAAIEIGGSLLLGLLIGIPMTYLTGRISDGTPTQAEAFGFVLLCAGLAGWLELSPILAAMVAGSVVGSLAKHHKRPFHALEAIEWPFLTLFFILAGASLELSPEFALSGLLLLYIFSRGIGTSIGAWAGARACGIDPSIGRWMGLALLPQAGVALGMALLAAQRFPEYADLILGTVLMSTVVLEIASPVITRVVLKRTEHTPVRARKAD